MRVSSHPYFLGLDHLRALAVFLVFVWHFGHIQDGYLSPPPLFPLSLLAEGHTGVSLFVVLSGYLFAKLIDGKKILYLPFLWNRCVRLLPLLLAVLFVAGLVTVYRGESLPRYLRDIAKGTLEPTLPNGGWSITVEFHFYILLPALLFLKRKSRFFLVLLLIAALLFRLFLFQQIGSIQKVSYTTLLGRIDQFLFGILFFEFRSFVQKKHLLFVLSFLFFALYYTWFDSLGGYYNNGGYPSKHSIWIYTLTIEGAFYALFVAWYDTSFQHSQGTISLWIAKIGVFSYSIYLWHQFLDFEIAKFVHSRIMDLSTIYLRLLWGSLCFFLMIPIGYLSHRWIESPFFAFRKRYILDEMIRDFRASKKR